ncbi:MAG: chemotaxis protein CheW, partial [Gammaproteobacteria bacterium]|nr:chemotaxis protein CheW [Gammaproteobacteria bacterium]
TGLVVEEVYGMRHFRKSDLTTDIPEIHEKITPYVDSAFKQADEHWPVLDIKELIQDERFAHVSL